MNRSPEIGGSNNPNQDDAPYDWRGSLRAGLRDIDANQARHKQPESSHPAPEGTKKKAKGHPAFKAALGGLALAAAVAAGMFTGNMKNNNKRLTDTLPLNPTESAQGTNEDDNQAYEKSDYKSLTGYEVLDRTIDGSFLQYDNIGCYNSDGKVNPNSVGNPDMVLEAMGINPENVTPEERGAVQEYFAYSMEEAAAGVAVVGKLGGFEDLSLAEAETKIHSMSQEEKYAFQDDLKQFFDNVEYHYETGNGMYENQAIIENEEGEKQSHYVESDLTGKQILVGEYSLTDNPDDLNLEYTTMEEMPDGLDFDNASTIEIVFKEDCGNLVYKITLPDGTIKTYIQTWQKDTWEKHHETESHSEKESESERESETNPPIIPPSDNPSTNPPSDNPSSNPPQNHPHKNEAAETTYAGKDANQMDVDYGKANSETSHESQKSTNRESVNQQAAEDATAKAQAEAAAQAQAQAEAAAAAQAQAEAAARAQAAAEAAARAQAAAEAEAQAAAAAAAQEEARIKTEAEAAARAQEEADRAAAAAASSAPEANSAADFAAAAAAEGFNN